MRFGPIYFLSYLLDAPLFGLYSMLCFILTKELHATALVITIYVSVKPLTALFSPYWSALMRSRSIESRLRALVLVACTPALLLPFIESTWFAIAAFAVYFFADRAAIAGWMELLKRKVAPEERNWVVSKSGLLMFLAGALVPVLAAPWLDLGPLNWRWLFFGLGVLSILRLFVLSPLAKGATPPPAPQVRSSPFTPWREAIDVLRRRPDFAFFQTVFLFGGTGLMMMQTVMPTFVNSILHLSYTELALAFALAKGIGYAASAYLWARLAKRIEVYGFAALVAALAALCLFLIPLSEHLLPMLYVALFLYGVMQGGSQLNWQLSGAQFSGKEESTAYTGVNIMAVGLRGCFAPTLGSSLALAIGCAPTLLIAGGICLMGSLFGLIGHRLFAQAQKSKLAP